MTPGIAATVCTSCKSLVRLMRALTTGRRGTNLWSLSRHEAGQRACHLVVMMRHSLKRVRRRQRCRRCCIRSRPQSQCRACPKRCKAPRAAVYREGLSVTDMSGDKIVRFFTYRRERALRTFEGLQVVQLDDVFAGGTGSRTCSREGKEGQDRGPHLALRSRARQSSTRNQQVER